MDRKQRIDRRKYQTAVNINDAARALDRAMVRAGIQPSEKQPFLDWMIAGGLEEFRKVRAGRRLAVENDIHTLGIRFPNGTVGRNYSFSFALPADKVSDVVLAGGEALGLTMSADESGKYTVSGIPSKPGDFVISLRYRTVDGEPVSELKLPVAFNPDPRSLWRNIPTDPDELFYKPDSETDYVKVVAGADGLSRKDIVAASQRGRSHAQEGKARDDHFNIFHCKESDWYIIAVADGAGSARFSRRGSEIACDTVVGHCRNMLLDNPAFEEAIRSYNAAPEDTGRRSLLTTMVHDIVLKGAKKAHDKINETANGQPGLRPKDFATTLMFAICKRYEFGWFIASFWVGDGAMCLFDAEKKTAKLLGTPDEGEFSGQTRFLTMPEIFRTSDVYKRLRMAVVPDFTALFLMSDGISDPMFETDRNLNDYARWEEFYNRLRNGFPEDRIGGVDLSDDNEASKDQLLGWLDFWSPGNHDDRTIAILY